MVQKKTLISKNEKDTAKIARDFASQIIKFNKTAKEAGVFGLVGELGAGKTAFVKVLAKALGVKTKLNSPTFVIMKKYPLGKNGQYKYLFHLDAYRLKNEKELKVLGWEAIVSNPEHLVFVEWPDNVGGAMPMTSKYIHISHGDQGQRHFKLP